jgi:hypothetical protein
VRSDLRHLLRTLRHAPASALAATITVALTLAAGTSIFALVDAVLLTPPPFANPGALMTLARRRWATPQRPGRRDMQRSNAGVNARGISPRSKRWMGRT